MNIYIKKYIHISLYFYLILIFCFFLFFSGFFKNLLKKSKNEFHDMFIKTYGIIYEENAYVFSDFFNELDSYYTRGKVDLSVALDLFFNTLYQKMFTVLNAQYQFEDK